MKNLTLIIPAKDEAKSLPIFLDELQKYDCDILIVASKEDRDAYQSIKKTDKTKIIFQEKKGYGNALIEGLSFSKTEYSCIINADGSMNPKYLLRFFHVNQRCC